MRGNGLSAAAYVAVVDLDPESADVLLLTLADHGVAAYASVSPEPPDQGPAVDRIYVDTAAEQLARSLVNEQLATVNRSIDDEAAAFEALDVDAAFAAIVAGFDQAPSPVPPPAAQEQPGSDPTLGWGDLVRAQPPPVPADDPEDRYIPPPPPPLPEADLVTRFGWAGVVGGPTMLFGAALFNWEVESWLLLLAAIAFLGGFVALVSRLDPDRDSDDPDNGAVV